MKVCCFSMFNWTRMSSIDSSFQEDPSTQYSPTFEMANHSPIYRGVREADQPPQPVQRRHRDHGSNGLGHQRSIREHCRCGERGEQGRGRESLSRQEGRNENGILGRVGCRGRCRWCEGTWRRELDVFPTRIENESIISNSTVFGLDHYISSSQTPGFIRSRTKS